MLINNHDESVKDKDLKEQKNQKDPADKKQDKIKALKKQLQYECRNAWDMASEDDREFAYAFAEEYKNFLDQARTEREFVVLAVETLENMGFVPIHEKEILEAGDKVYKNIRNKGVVAAVVGRKPAIEGFNLIGAHIDAPRIDLKPNPIYEDSDLVFFKTHYYGGIKKYQWTAVPLSLHGIIYREDGTPLTISIGDNPEDPVFTMTDLLPHLGTEQMGRKATEVIKGEDLNVLIGGLPYPDTDASGRFKLAILEFLQKSYDLTERDFLSAELEIVPANPARDVGLDRSFIGAYAQDDRSCAFPALVALTSIDRPQRTIVTLLFDKEEIGSEGSTGAQSRLYENFLYEIYVKSTEQASQFGYNHLLENSRLLSGDVTNGYDPTFSSVSDPRNNAYLGKGLNLQKYAGSRGKSGTSDANAEFLSSVIRLLNDNKIAWQTGELGKVDAGGGGTIAKFMANLGMEVLDCGLPVLSMHSPFEITSKIDLYHTFLAFKAFFEQMK
jgi:aspartyl aminopeptidase